MHVAICIILALISDLTSFRVINTLTSLFEPLMKLTADSENLVMACFFFLFFWCQFGFNGLVATAQNGWLPIWGTCGTWPF